MPTRRRNILRIAAVLSGLEVLWTGLLLSMAWSVGTPPSWPPVLIGGVSGAIAGYWLVGRQITADVPKPTARQLGPWQRFLPLVYIAPVVGILAARALDKNLVASWLEGMMAFFVGFTAAAVPPTRWGKLAERMARARSAGLR